MNTQRIVYSPPVHDTERAKWLTGLPQTMEDIKAGPSLLDNCRSHPYRIHDRKGVLTIRCASIVLACWRLKLDQTARLIFDDSRNQLQLIDIGAHGDESATALTEFAQRFNPLRDRYSDGKSALQRLSPWLKSHGYADAWTGSPGNPAPSRVFVLWP